MAKFSAAVQAARGRRAGRAKQSAVEIESFVDEVSKRIDLTLKQRVYIAVNFLQDRIVKNVSVPVTKMVIGGRTRVTERSKRGEYPRADTTQLRKTIFWDVVDNGAGQFTGHVGSPLWYSMPLELMMQRQFLTRTLDEQRGQITRILTGPIA
jgi:hypothetical protein